MSNGDKFVGKAKETAGKVTGNEELEAEGKVQHAKGEVEEKVDDAKDTAKGASKGVRDAFSGDDKRA